MANAMIDEDFEAFAAMLGLPKANPCCARARGDKLRVGCVYGTHITFYVVACVWCGEITAGPFRHPDDADAFVAYASGPFTIGIDPKAPWSY